MGTEAVLALFGPTAVGKTAVAVALATRMRSEGAMPVAVSADAFQVYRGLELLSGAPSAAQRLALEHRLVGILDVWETHSVAAHARLAHAAIDDLLAVGATPIVLGGTGLYLRAALAELTLAPSPPPQLRARLAAQLAEHGAGSLHAELARRDVAAAARVAPTDGRRIVRALELAEMGVARPAGGTSSELWSAATRHPTRLIGLTMDRAALYAQIDARVDAMLAQGAAEEVRAAASAGASHTARQAIGFKELLVGDVERLRQATRRYAKRQLTWMAKLAGVERHDVTGRSPDEVARALQ